MSNEEAKQAFLQQLPVVHNCHTSRGLIVYARIKQYIHTIADHKMSVSLALTDEKERVLIFAAPSEVAIYDENKPLERGNYF